MQENNILPVFFPHTRVGWSESAPRGVRNQFWTPPFLVNAIRIVPGRPGSTQLVTLRDRDGCHKEVSGSFLTFWDWKC
jgi:hypothetical protein